MKASKSLVEVVQIQRRPLDSHFSIEGYFSRIRDHIHQNADIRCYELPCFSRGIWGRLRNCLGAFRNQRDVNHVTGDIHYVACFLDPRRTLLTVHDCQVLERLRGWKRAIVKFFWYTLPIRNAVRITVNSNETKRQLLREVRYPPERIHVIPVSVSSLFQPFEKPFNAECPCVLQVGTKSNKNLLRLIHALGGIRCRLEIVGPIDSQTRVLLNESKLEYRNHERLTDQSLVELYRGADIVSFVSTHEGFGMPIVEAQWVERVCVTSNCSSMPEVAGFGACLVDPFDVMSIRAGFERVIAEPAFRKSLIEAGRRNRERFESHRIADAFLELYREVLEESG